MDEMTRRQALKLGSIASAALAATPAARAAAPEDEGAAEESPKSKDRTFVIEAGMTEAEADCWELAAKAAGAFFALPEMHPMDSHEVASAIHVIQNKLLGRPTYRKYLEAAKAGR